MCILGEDSHNLTIKVQPFSSTLIFEDNGRETLSTIYKSMDIS